MTTMSYQKSQKLKSLLNAVPPGFLVDGRFLRTHSITSKSIGDYVAQGWLERIGRGVYRRPLPTMLTEPLATTKQDNLDNLNKATATTDQEQSQLHAASAVPAVVAAVSMQRIMGYDCHVGGFSALALLGHLHHLPFGAGGSLHLYGEVPSWLSRVALDATPRVHTHALFAGDGSLGIIDAEHSALLGSQELSVWPYTLRIATPERAILEAINDLPDHTTFDSIDQLFEGLTALRPKLAMSLLRACRSVKVKRLFFVFADRHQHAWREHLDLGAVDLGSGPRALVAGGKLHHTYRIYVAEPYLPVSMTGTTVSSQPSQTDTNLASQELEDD